jgi:hypothetical protein
MSIKKITPTGTNRLWWENAYPLNESIHVQYELEFGKDIIKPGNKIRIKNDRNIYQFRCLAHNISLDKTWIDCISADGGWRSFPVSKLKCLVKPKRSRRKKANV